MQYELLDSAWGVTNPGEETAKNANKDCDNKTDDAVQVERGRIQHGLPIAENGGIHISCRINCIQTQTQDRLSPTRVERKRTPLRDRFCWPLAEQRGMNSVRESDSLLRRHPAR